MVWIRVRGREEGRAMLLVVKSLFLPASKASSPPSSSPSSLPSSYSSSTGKKGRGKMGLWRRARGREGGREGGGRGGSRARDPTPAPCGDV